MDDRLKQEAKAFDRQIRERDLCHYSYNFCKRRKSSEYSLPCSLSLSLSPLFFPLFRFMFGMSHVFLRARAKFISVDSSSR